MKIALICPSNLLYMPYVGNYEKILKENNTDYDIINWDRFNIETKNNFLTYRDSKVGHQRNFIDYYKYRKFVIKNLKRNKYGKVIVFGMQLAFFLKDILEENFEGNYIIDIRDYHKIINYFSIGKLIDNSSFTVLSSPGFKKWLPTRGNYIINHNTQISNLNALREVTNDLIKKEKINIAYIGAIRDYKINIDFIESLKNSSRIDIYFHGEGVINKDIDRYLKLNSIKNVKLTGRYKKEDEEGLYADSDLINILIPNDCINSKTLLPNRLYNASIKGKPILAFNGTYLAEQVKKYNLGMILDSFNETEKKINYFLENFNMKEYENGRTLLLNKVIQDNEIFKINIENFIRIKEYKVL